MIEVAFDGKSYMDVCVPEGYPNFSWVSLNGQDNINSVVRRREVLEVARKLHKSGLSVLVILVWLRLPSISAPISNPILAEGNIGSVYDSRSSTNRGHPSLTYHLVSMPSKPTTLPRQVDMMVLLIMNEYVNG